MTSKLLVVIATGNKEKAVAGLMYARNAIRNRWLDDVKVVFFGPSEQLVSACDDKLAFFVREITALTNCFACRAISDEKGVSEKLAEVGIEIEYVGTVISDLIKEGYVPMVW